MWFQPSPLTFNVTTHKYKGTFSWRNPRVPVDRFELQLLYFKRNNVPVLFGEPTLIKAKDGTGLIYSADLEFNPGRVYSVLVRSGLANWRLLSLFFISIF